MKRMLPLAAIMLTTAAVTVLFAAGESETARETERATLSVAVPDLPGGTEPSNFMGNTGTRITYSVYDPLVRRDFLSSEDGTGAALEPALAESWEWVEQDRFRVTLREGVTFHNGNTLTTDDVLFTFSDERMRGDTAAVPRAAKFFTMIDRMEKIDDLHMDFVLTGPDPAFPHRLASFGGLIVDAESWIADKGDGQFPLNPVGTGPFRVVSGPGNGVLVLERFDEYWGETANIQRVEIREVPEDSSRIAGMIAGEYDIVTSIAPDQRPRLEAEQGFRVIPRVLANSHVLIYDVADAPLDDRRVRLALNLAIDRQLIVDTIWDGLAGSDFTHQFAEYGQLYDPAREKGECYGYDPERAAGLLRDAGYAGELIEIATLPHYYTNAVPVAETIVSMWTAVGINAGIRIAESWDQIKPGNTMVRNGSNTTRIPDPTGTFLPSWGPASREQREYWTNAPERFNRLAEELVTETDMERRADVFQTLLDIFECEAPGTVLYQPAELYLVRDDVEWTPYHLFYLDLRAYNLK